MEGDKSFYVFESLVLRMNKLEDIEANLQQTTKMVEEMHRANKLQAQRAEEFDFLPECADDGQFYYVDSPIVGAYDLSCVGLRTETPLRPHPHRWSSAFPRAQFAHVYLSIDPKTDFAARRESLLNFTTARNIDIGITVFTEADAEKANEYCEDAMPTRVAFTVHMPYSRAWKFWDELLVVALDAAAAMEITLLQKKEAWVELLRSEDVFHKGELVVRTWR